MKQFVYVVIDELGLHARPAGLLAKEVKKYTSTISLKKGDKAVPAKGVMGLMTLNVKKGDEITIIAEGEDEDKAITELEQFLKANL